MYPENEHIKHCWTTDCSEFYYYDPSMTGITCRKCNHSYCIRDFNHGKDDLHMPHELADK